MTLKEYTYSLSKDKQYELAFRLTKLALPIWDKYADKNELIYRDTVVGLNHTVDRMLLKNSIDASEEYLKSNNLEKSILPELRKQYDDPIIALQDNDWELPDEVLKIFYSVYNLIEAILGNEQTVFEESAIIVSINQAVDALETSKILTFDEIKAYLKE